MLLAMVPDAPPTWKNQRATSCPAPISANVPYLFGSRLIWSAFCSVPGISRVIADELFTKLSLRRARKELRQKIVGERGPLAYRVRRLAGDSAPLHEPPLRPSRPRPRPRFLLLVSRTRTRTRTIGFMAPMRESGIVDAPRAGCPQPAAFRSGCECINELGNRFKAVPANLSANHSSA